MGILMRARPSSDNAWDPADRPLIVGGVITIALVLLSFMFLLGMAALDVWSGIIVFLVLVFGAVPVLRRVARAEGDPWLFKVFYAGLIVKLLSSMVRYFVIFVVYDGNGDAGVYHEAGTTFARRFAAGEPIHPLPKIEAFPVETHWIADLTGVLYTATGPSAYAGFFFFSTLCFMGQVLMVLAFKVAVPEGDYRRLALLVLFLPSLLFWPSSIGKESLMIGCIGLVTYGGGLLLAPRPRLRGVLFFALGTIGLTFVRPHISYMSVAALGLAMAIGVLVGGGIRGANTRGRLLRITALIVLLGLASFASTRMAARFADEEGDGGATSTLEATLEQTSTGGSEFVPAVVSTPLDLPLGIVSVVFRPLPWEARSFNALIAAAEGLLLIGLFAVSWRRVVSFPAMALRRPFLVFVGAYALVFAIGFSFLANFGILARQRTQMMPMLLMLLALPAYNTLRERFSSSDGGEDDPSEGESEVGKLAASVPERVSSADGDRSGV